ncbi:MAG: phenylalanine--tRNA ligase subunit beta [Acidobacteriota bacterium]
MKISYSWLRDYIALDQPVEEVSRQLTLLGLAVDAVVPYGPDFILDVDVTTNRPDCLSHIGIARELSAFYGVPLTAPVTNLGESAAVAADTPAEIEILDRRLCSRYSARVIFEVQIGPSPDWLRERLLAVGQRPINNVVDVTNYVLLERGHPLHAFDFDRLEQHQIKVRRARRGEKLKTLDGNERKLDTTMLVIADATRAVALAGVMGGFDSEVTEGTTRLLLESAHFEPLSVRRTSRALGLKTEASYRFERGADVRATVTAVDRAAELILKVAGGRVAGGLLDVYPRPRPPRTAPLRRQKLDALVGQFIPDAFVEERLDRLGFHATRGHAASGPAARGRGRWKVTIPSWRVDVAIEEDLIEEVARHYGFDKIESRLPAWSGRGSYPVGEARERDLLDCLRGAGFYEAVTYSLVHPDWDSRFRHGLLTGQAAGATTPLEAVALANPLSDEDSHLRTALLGGLVRSLAHNLNHGQQDVRLFEIGKVFSGANGSYLERSHLGLVATGCQFRQYWNSISSATDWFFFKGVVEEIGRRLRVDRVEFGKSSCDFLHPGNSAEVFFASRHVGFLGSLHPDRLELLKIRQDVFVAEFDLEAINAIQPVPVFYENIERLPQVERDFSFVVAEGTAYNQIVAAIKGLNLKEIKDISVIDVYRGAKVPEGKYSLTVRLVLQHPNRTLTQEEIQSMSQAVVRVLGEQVQAKPR